MAYKSAAYITKKDQGDKSRAFVYIQERIVEFRPDDNEVITKAGNRYILRNIDSYFLADKPIHIARLEMNSTLSK